jgi:2-dehydropantoate 2-reductase
MMSKTIKSICVYGIGGVGGYFGGRIAHEVSKGNRAVQVYFIGREEHLKAIQQHGLNLITDKEEFLCFPNIATDNIRHIPTPDYERIRTGLQKGIVSPACVYVSSSIEKPGTVRQKGPEGHIVFGKDPKHLGYNYEYLIEFFNEMGVSNTWYDNPYPAIWEKYIFITALSLMTAYSGKTLGEVLSDDKLKSMTENIMKEVVLIGKTKNIDFEQDIVEKIIQKAKNFPYESKTSFQRDYEKGNRRHEGDIFGGTLIRLAKEYNVSIPTITKVYGGLISR